MSGPPPKHRSAFDSFMETLMAILLGAMTLILFANVVVRYLFNLEALRPTVDALGLPTNLLWALEATVYLFAWLVLLGAAYCVKINAHLGVDVVARLFGDGPRKVMALLSGALCIAFAGLLLVGSWNYWAPFANLPPVPNLWNDWIAGPLGLGEVQNSWRDQAWYEVDAVPMPDWLRFIEPIFNQGERYEYIPRFIPYAILPLASALLLWRFVQATIRVWRDRQELLIASHEAEDDIDEAAARAAGERG